MRMKTTVSVTGVQQERGHVRRSACQGQQLSWRFFLPQVQKQVGLSQGDWIFLQGKKTGKNKLTRESISVSSLIPGLSGARLCASLYAGALQNTTPGSEDHALSPVCLQALGMRIEQRTVPLGRAKRNLTRLPLNASTRNYKETRVGQHSENWEQSLSLLKLQWRGTKHQHQKD